MTRMPRSNADIAAVVRGLYDIGSLPGTPDLRRRVVATLRGWNDLPIRPLFDLFGVSTGAMARRLAELRLVT